uniref:Uncharacterized protein n=1 Tax=Rhizophora mucronata TaxID=61149 RepID=A0A2P2R187_RHIMU
MLNTTGTDKIAMQSWTFPSGKELTPKPYGYEILAWLWLQVRN